MRIEIEEAYKRDCLNNCWHQIPLQTLAKMWLKLSSDIKCTLKRFKETSKHPDIAIWTAVD